MHSSNSFILGVDIGGSHISAGLVNAGNGELLSMSVRRNSIIQDGGPEQIIRQWADTLKASLSSADNYHLSGIAMAIPGPFNYREGISLMKGVNKYDALYTLNVKDALKAALDMDIELPMLFENDAACFGLGESLHPEHQCFGRMIAVTLGTGFGSTFLENGKVVKQGAGVSPNGELYNTPYLDGVSEDYVSGRWLLSTYNRQAVKAANSVFTIAQRAASDKEELAIRVFDEFGKHLASCLGFWIKAFKAECIIIGGSIAKSFPLFLPAFNEILQQQGLILPVKISEFMEFSAIKGAAALMRENDPGANDISNDGRKSSQPLMPLHTASDTKVPGKYDLYPSFNIGSGAIFSGYDSLGEWLLTQRHVMIDGFCGVDWYAVRSGLSEYFQGKGIGVCWYETSAFQQSPAIIDALVEPFIGEPGSVWGTQALVGLSDFYDIEKLSQLKVDVDASLHIVIGTGASFAKWKSLVYFDIPKNEIQYRMRAGKKVSITETSGLSNAEIYKRLYFVDWVIHKRHRQNIYEQIAVVADGQWGDQITWAFSDAVYKGLEKMTHSVIRARPWFEAGAWGGQWLKRHISGLNPEEVNYAWSFELIVPENGLVLESDGRRLEVAFDWLMEKQAVAMLGEDEKTFGTAFPIRFDYLDTMDGGNLSIQCHPSNEYIRREFGEDFTQDETYYILDCAEDATVYLGFQEDIHPDAFRQALEESRDKNIALNITDYVQVHPAKKHDLFLIPNQTIHSAGKNNLVLEISATPYIFTFKMYDWLRLDLEGNPRPINIGHAFHNLDFSRKGEKVAAELISRPSVIEQSEGYKLVHLPTHEVHFYDVHRIEFSATIKMNTNGKCLVMMLVEGQSVLVTVEGKEPVRLNYAETFVIPAAVGPLEMINESQGGAKVIKAFIK